MAGNWLSPLIRSRQRQRQPTSPAANSETVQNSATHWQQLYWAEVQLRQADSTRAQATIAELQSQIQAGPVPVPADPLSPEQLSRLKQEVAQYGTVLELKARLLEVLSDRQGLQAQVQALAQAVAAEQQAHAQTRHSLTTSLSDAIESLVQLRQNPQPTDRDKI